jgi:ABC-type oligopeptide transport system substrate-binding subunit
MTWEEFLDRTTRGEPHLWRVGAQVEFPDPTLFLYNTLWQRCTGWHHESYEQPVQQAREMRDEEERMAVYRRAEQFLVEEAPILPLGYSRMQLSN